MRQMPETEKTMNMIRALIDHIHAMADVYIASDKLDRAAREELMRICAELHQAERTLIPIIAQMKLSPHKTDTHVVVQTRHN